MKSLKTNETDIKEKIDYCAGCVIKPCQAGCPLDNDITGFIKLLKENKKEEAYKLLSETTVLPSVCGRICPHEKQCQGSCAKGVSFAPVQIGNIEAYLGDLAIENNWKISKAEKRKEKIAVIGAGPSGLTCAGFLARKGYNVTIYEKHGYLGGILAHGIPEFRLNREVLEKTIKRIIDLGIEVKLNMELGKDYTLEQLLKNYDAIFLGFGANVSRKMNIEGENLEGVYGGNELLENKLHPDYKGKKVAVIGGGNVAMDTARTIKKLGADEVTVIYRRSEEEMPAELKEIKEAKEENVKFLFQTNILKIMGNNKVEKIECIKTELIQKENEQRLSPVNVEGSEFLMYMDYVVMAVGAKTEAGLLDLLGLELNSRGYIKTNLENQTSNPKVFAGGDLIGNKATVAWAARSGRNSADAIERFLEK